MYKGIHIRTQEAVHLEDTFTVEPRMADCVVSIPHGGPYVLADYAQHFTFGRGILVDNDMYTSELYPRTLGSCIYGHLAPHQLNLNRSWMPVDGRDPLRTESYLPEDPLYIGEWATEERQTLQVHHARYHAALAELLTDMRNRNGYALLFDCHSLNSRALANTPDVGSTDRADFIIGSLDDTSADPRVIDIFHNALEKRATALRLRVVRNDPYKGGYITKTWGRPPDHLHALQLELKKALYMHEGLDNENDAFKMKPSFVEIQQLLYDAFEETTRLTRTLLCRTT